jgi:hypothetical protein
LTGERVGLGAPQVQLNARWGDMTEAIVTHFGAIAFFNLATIHDA